MSKLYSKTGDGGETSLYGGQRVPKHHFRLEAYGTIDELNAVLAFCLAQPDSEPYREFIQSIQRDLFKLGAELAAPPGRIIAGLATVNEEQVTLIEQAIDKLSDKLPPLHHFIIPGGTALSASLHLARTICRRAERRVVELASRETVRPIIISYLNRLGDYLFALARQANQRAAVSEIIWQR